ETHTESGGVSSVVPLICRDFRTTGPGKFGKGKLPRRKKLRFFFWHLAKLVGGARPAFAFFFALGTLPIFFRGTPVPPRSLGSAGMPSLDVSPVGGRVGN